MINEMSVRCFLSLSKTLSFTDSAKQLYITQQGVSKYIAKLEGDLGVSLFIRTRHYVKLTEAGSIYARLFQRFSDEFRRTGEEIQALEIHPRRLTVGYMEWLELSGQMAQVLSQLKKEYPNLQFSGEKRPPDELNRRLSSGQLDLIITYREFLPTGHGIRRLKVMETPMVLLVSVDNPKATPDATAEDFKREPFIKAATAQESLAESRARARKRCRELGFDSSKIIISPNLESAYLATELGQGVLVSTMLSQMTHSSRFLRYPLKQNEELLCCWREDEGNPAVAEFATQFEAVVSGRIHDE